MSNFLTGSLGAGPPTKGTYEERHQHEIEKGLTTYKLGVYGNPALTKIGIPETDEKGIELLMGVKRHQVNVK